MPILSSNVTLVIVATMLPDMIDVITYDQDPNGEGKIWGATGWLLSNATKALGCRIKVITPRDGQIGHYDSNETLYGQYADAYEGIADIVAGPSAREDVLDKYLLYSDVYDGIKLWGLISGMRHAYITNPLPYDATALQAIAIAFLICLATIICALIINYIDLKRHPYAAHSPGGIVAIFIQSFFLEATHLRVYNNKLRIIYGAFLFTMLVFTNYIQSEMRSSSMLQIPTQKIDTIDDVLARPNCRLNCPAEMFFYIQNTTWRERIQNDSGIFRVADVLNESRTNAILDQKAALIFPTVMYMKFMRELLCPNPNLKGFFYLGSQAVYEPPYVFRFRPGFNKTIIKEFNKRMRWLREGTVPWYERRGFDIRTISCLIYEESAGKKLMTVSESFKFENIKPIMYLWLIMLAGSGVVLICEIITGSLQLNDKICHFKLNT